MIRSRLFLRLFSMILATVGLFASAIYLFSVPLIERTAYEIELNASRTILDNVFVMAAKISGSLEDRRAAALAARRTELSTAVSLAAAYVDDVFGRRQRGEISAAEAGRQVQGGLRVFRSGTVGDIWLADDRVVLRSGAAPAVDGASGPTLPILVRMAKEKGEGFFPSEGRRPDAAGPAERKIAYVKDLPRWGLVIGAAADPGDTDAEMARRKQAAIADLRQALRQIRIARTGYVYIFDAADTMIIHPNGNIEGSAFGSLADPATGRPIGEELRAAADSGHPLTYLWDKPDDPGHYVYEKMSWVRHFEGFDWYIASSVYGEELRRSSAVLGHRLLAIAVALMILAGGLGYGAVRRLVRPLNRLAETAALVRAGHLDVESGIRRVDEIGVLADAFDGMIRRVRDDIATLDSRVRDRTGALAESEAWQRLILDATPAAIAYLGRDEIVRFANRSWAELVRQDKAAVIGRSLEAAIGRRAHASIAPHLDVTWSGAQTSFDYAFTNAEGRPVITKNSLIPRFGADGAVTGLFVLALDVTDERATEQRLMEAQRMKAVGQLSGGLAHDFNNLLSIILGNLAAARERYAEVEGLDSYLEPAQRASRRGADITSRLLAFSRQHPMKPEPVEVCALVREIAILLRRSLPAGIELVGPRDGAACWAIADQSQLENALVNLALNARDAMPGGGRLTMAVAVRKVSEPLAFDETVAPDDYLEIRVADSGCGFAPEALSRAFEPFFSTKAQGSGLGLSMVYGFVKQSRGYIRLDSAPGEGTTVTILLPRAEPAPLEVEAPAPVVADAGRWQGQLALVAEDDDDVRQVMRRQLMELGFSVIEAQSGDEAAELVERIEGLGLVVSDIAMPGLGGIELARRLRAARPDIRVILVSGFSVDAGEDRSDLVILRKPWDKRDLIAAIAS